MTKAGMTTDDDAVKPDQSKAGDPDEKPSKLELFLLLAAVFLSMILVFVDRTIISTVREHSPLNRASLPRTFSFRETLC